MSTILELESVTKRYGESRDETVVDVLRGVSLSLDSGDSVAIVGPSGCGKSTLLNIIGGLDRQSSGSVRLDGRELSSLDDNELAAVRNRDIGFVFQLHHLLPQCTVMENVLIPTLPARDRQSAYVVDRARQLLNRVGLGARVDHRPAQLSGGEMQRAAVVRALINGPRLLLADEPTGSLDGETADELGQLLRDLNNEQDLTLVVVTHSTTLAERMSRRLVLQNGVLITGS